MQCVLLYLLWELVARPLHPHTAQPIDQPTRQCFIVLAEREAVIIYAVILYRLFISFCSSHLFEEEEEEEGGSAWSDDDDDFWSNPHKPVE